MSLRGNLKPMCFWLDEICFFEQGTDTNFTQKDFYRAYSALYKDYLSLYKEVISIAVRPGAGIGTLLVEAITTLLYELDLGGILQIRPAFTGTTTVAIIPDADFFLAPDNKKIFLLPKQSFLLVGEFS